MPRVTFRALGVTTELADGLTLFEAGAKVSAGIDTSCVGKGTCGLCRVRVLEGEAHLSPYSAEETKHLGNLYFVTKIRLSCRAHVSGGDVVVDVVTPRKKKGETR